MKMKPKEKAKNLIEMFIPNVANDGYNKRERVENKNAVRCAIICVDEIIKAIQLLHINHYNKTVDFKATSAHSTEIKNWKRVKEEINKIK